MFEILRALSTIVDAAEGYFDKRIKNIVGSTAERDIVSKERDRIKKEFGDKKPKISEKQYAKGEQNLENSLKKKYPREYKLEQNFYQKDGEKYIKGSNRIEKIQKVRNILQPGPFKKFRSLRDNILDIEKNFRAAFGTGASAIFEMITGFTFEEFMGFVNQIRYYQGILLHLDPIKVSKDLVRSIAIGVNDMMSELHEITGHDTIELSDKTEISNLSSSGLQLGGFMRMGAGTNITSYGTLYLGDKNGKAYIIPNCPEQVWAQMKAATGKDGHGYAPSGAGSGLGYFRVTGQVSEG